MDNTIRIAPAKINTKALKILGIISAVSAILYIISGFISLFVLGPVIHNSIIVSSDVFSFISYLLNGAPFILFGLYATVFSKKKFNHPTLLISNVLLIIYGIFQMIKFDINNFFGAFFREIIVSTFAALKSMVELDFDAYLYALWDTAYFWSILLFALIPLVFIIDICTNFRLAIVSKFSVLFLLIVVTINELMMALDVINLFDYYLEYFPVHIFLPVLQLLQFIPFCLFWMVVIKKGPKTLKTAPQPIQPVSTQPAVQPTVQPTAQPAVQNSSPENNRYNEETVKLLKIQNLLEMGLITQEEFDKKKAEIIDNI